MELGGLQRPATVAALIDGALAPSTKAMYGQVWVQLSDNCKIPQEKLFPVPVQILADYLASMFEAGYSSSTMASHASAISYGHKIRGLPDPAADFRIKQLLAGARKYRPSSDARHALTLPEIRVICAALRVIGLDLRDRLAVRAIILLGFFALLRPGELVVGAAPAHTIGNSDVQITGQKLRVIIPSSKTDAAPACVDLLARPSLDCCPVQAVRAYIRVKRHSRGAFFQNSKGVPFSVKKLSAILKQAAAAAGLDARHISGHCLRIGGASHGALKGLSELQLAEAGRWRSCAVRRYVRRSVSVLSVT